MHRAAGRRIQELRRALEPPEGERVVTQSELARRVDVAHGTVTAWEGGYQLPEGENLVALAKVLGTTPSYLVEGPNELTLPPVSVRASGGVRESARVRGDYSAEVRRSEFGNVEPWLQSLLVPDSLRRMVRTVEGRQVIKGLRGVIADLDWPNDMKRAADAILSDALLDEGPPES